MPELIINISDIEELQTLNDVTALDKLFKKANQAIAGGEKVILVRRYGRLHPEKVEEITTAGALQEYREKVYKYLSP